MDLAMKRTIKAFAAMIFCGAVLLSGTAALCETITLQDLSALPSGVRAEGSTLIIESAGTYTLTGTLEEGQILVDADGEDEVTLILDGVTIFNASQPAIMVEDAKQTTLTLADGSQNSLQSGETAALDGSAIDPDASGGAVYAKDDLIIEGNGTLFVGGYLNNGIHTSNAFILRGGELQVEAVNNGVKGKDAVTIGGGSLHVISGGDGIDSDDEAGVVSILGGDVDVVSTEDGIQAETTIEIAGGTISVVSGGGSQNAPEQDDGFDDPFGGHGGGFGGPFGGQNGGFGGMGGGGRMPSGLSGTDEQTEEEPSGAKGIKAGTLLRITGGTIDVDSSDDALHSNGSTEISGGEMTLSTGDDAIHADDSLTIDGSTIRILTSYEGLEANQILISGGDIDAIASDDGINANGGAGTWGPWSPMTWNAESDGEMPNLIVTGGTVYVDAQGDGLDSNGNILVEGGYVIVDGPSQIANGALDVGMESGGTCIVHGGTVLAIGSAGMAESFGRESTQVSFSYTLGQTAQAGSELVITATDGTELIRHTASRNFQSVVFSCPEMQKGQTVTLSVDGQSEQIELTDITNSNSMWPGGGGWGRW